MNWEKAEPKRTEKAWMEAFSAPDQIEYCTVLLRSSPKKKLLTKYSQIAWISSLVAILTFFSPSTFLALAMSSTLKMSMALWALAVTKA